MRPLIIGIDPGTTAAFAVLDFEFNLLAVESRKSFSGSDMISSMIYLGDPVIMAGDKKDTPSFIKEMSQKLGTIIYSPGYDTKKGEKKRLVSQFHLSGYVDNPHETDALASAIMAFRSQKPLIKKIRSILRKSGTPELFDKVIEYVLLEKVSIKNAIATIQDKGETIKQFKKKRQHALTPPKKLSALEKQILVLKQQNFRLKYENMALHKKAKNLENKKLDIGAVEKRLLSQKEKKILFLEKKAKRLNDMLQATNNKAREEKKFFLDARDKKLIPRLNSLKKKDYSQKNTPYGDLAYIDDAKEFNIGVVEDMLKKGVRYLIVGNEPNIKLRDHFYLIPKKEIEIIESSSFVAASDKEIQKAVESSKAFNRKPKMLLSDLIKNYKEERKRKYGS